MRVILPYTHAMDLHAQLFSFIVLLDTLVAEFIVAVISIASTKNTKIHWFCKFGKLRQRVQKKEDKFPNLNLISDLNTSKS